MLRPLYSFFSSLKKKGLLILLVVPVVCMGTSSNVWGQREGGTAATPAPDFTLETIDGDTFQLTEHRGNVVVINFWATWCPPCRREIPGFIELQQEHGSRGLQFVGVALQRGAGAEAVRAFAREFQINYPVGVDDGTIAKKYGGVQRLPTTFVIGPQGNIQGRLPGFTPKAKLGPGLEKMLDDAS